MYINKIKLGKHFWKQLNGVWKAEYLPNQAKMGIPFTRKMVKFGCLSMKEAFLGSGSELLEYKWDDLE